MPWGTQEDSIMRILAHKYFRSFSVGHGHFMWNFRTEIEDRWSYLQVGVGQQAQGRDREWWWCGARWIGRSRMIGRGRMGEGRSSRAPKPMARP
jgi:hypothetical protein